MSVMERIERALTVLFYAFVLFPYNALTTPRQRRFVRPNERMKSNDMVGGAETDISESLYRLCTSDESVSSLLADDPTLTPAKAWKGLYGARPRSRAKRSGHEENESQLQATTGQERVKKCAKWGAGEPSELFLVMYQDALHTVDQDIERALVSPSLMGTSGVVPLTIISTIPDIVRHMSNLIVRAEKEVFLATNYWSNGVAVRFITNALLELSRRAGQRNGRVVVKILYDRGSVKQLVEPHYLVSEREFTAPAVGLPARSDIPHIDLEVMNYHHLLLGTFHSKFMVVDRRVGLVMSNNIQDNDNLEMMVHLEGPVVDALYDVALVSWHRRLDPPLPCLASPAARDKIQCFDAEHKALFSDDGSIRGHRAVVDPHKVNLGRAFGPDGDGDDGSFCGPGKGGPLPTTGPGASQTPTQANTKHVPEHTADSPHYDTSIAAEVLRVQASISGPPSPSPSLSTAETKTNNTVSSPPPPSQPLETPMQATSRRLNHTVNPSFAGTAPPCPPELEMTPYIPHQEHTPFPIALVCRHPHGPPNHSSVATPQNAAWLSALRNARKNVFIQSPTLNAEPLVPAIIDACERGVDVYCYICLGYNDAGELLPLQGGHNESVSHALHAALSPTALPRLHYFWYVAKDQIQPISQLHKGRSCHIKLLIVDECIAVVGSGNQDTQSWFHSQEVNVMLDSPDVCRAWIAALRRNQNTHRYGAVDRRDGVWRDEHGHEADGAKGVHIGPFSWATGVVGAVKRFQGKGGFG